MSWRNRMASCMRSTALFPFYLFLWVCFLRLVLVAHCSGTWRTRGRTHSVRTRGSRNKLLTRLSLRAVQICPTYCTPDAGQSLMDESHSGFHSLGGWLRIDCISEHVFQSRFFISGFHSRFSSINNHYCNHMYEYNVLLFFYYSTKNLGSLLYIL